MYSYIFVLHILLIYSTFLLPRKIHLPCLVILCYCPVLAVQGVTMLVMIGDVHRNVYQCVERSLSFIFRFSSAKKTRPYHALHCCARGNDVGHNWRYLHRNLYQCADRSLSFIFPFSSAKKNTPCPVLHYCCARRNDVGHDWRCLYRSN